MEPLALCWRLAGLKGLVSTPWVFIRPDALGPGLIRFRPVCCCYPSNGGWQQLEDSLGWGKRPRSCFFFLQLKSTRARLRIAKPTRNTAANNAASGKNLAITKPTPRNTDENRMAVRSVPMRGCCAGCPTHDDKPSIGSWCCWAIHPWTRSRLTPRRR